MEVGLHFWLLVIQALTHVFDYNHLALETPFKRKGNNLNLNNLRNRTFFTNCGDSVCVVFDIKLKLNDLKVAFETLMFL